MCRCTGERIRVRAGELCVPIGGCRVRPQARRRRRKPGTAPGARRGLPPYGAKPPHAGPGNRRASGCAGWRMHYRVAREKGVQPDSVRREHDEEKRRWIETARGRFAGEARRRTDTSVGGREENGGMNEGSVGGKRWRATRVVAAVVLGWCR